MSDPADLLEVGRVSKAHGLRGEVVVRPISDVDERFAAGSELVIDDLPRRIERSRRHHGRWVVKLEGVDDRDSAERLRGLALEVPMSAPRPDDGYWVHELVGRRVVTVDGSLVGTVTAVEDNPAHDLLVLDSGVLVPMVFVVDVDPAAITVELPDGLLDL